MKLSAIKQLLETKKNAFSKGNISAKEYEKSLHELLDICDMMELLYDCELSMTNENTLAA
jgi:hypothetical protein